MPFDERRVRNQHSYHRSCVWHVAHLIRLENFFWLFIVLFVKKKFG